MIGATPPIWKSPDIPNSPIAVRKDLPESFKKKLQDTLVGMSSKAPEVYRGIQSSTSRALTPDASYVRIDDSAFDGLRKLARGVKQVQLLEP